MALLHATCVSIGGDGVLIRGPSGRGKSDLALRLIDDGANLVADDYVNVRASAGNLLASPPSETRGLMEIRGLGLVALDAVSDVTVRLVTDLKDRTSIPRIPDNTRTAIEGIDLRWIEVDPEAASAPARIRAALRYPLATDRPVPSTTSA